MFNLLPTAVCALLCLLSPARAENNQKLIDNIESSADFDDETGLEPEPEPESDTDTETDADADADTVTDDEDQDEEEEVEEENETDGGVGGESDDDELDEAVTCRCNTPECEIGSNRDGVCSSSSQLCFMRIQRQAEPPLLGCVTATIANTNCFMIKMSMRDIDDVEDEFEIFLEVGANNRTFCCDTPMCNLKLRKTYAAFTARQERLRNGVGATFTIGKDKDVDSLADPGDLENRPDSLSQATITWLQVAAIVVPVCCFVVLSVLVYLAVRICRRKSFKTQGSDWMNVHLNLHLPLPKTRNGHGHGHAAPQSATSNSKNSRLDYVFTILPTGKPSQFDLQLADQNDSHQVALPHSHSHSHSHGKNFARVDEGQEDSSHAALSSTISGASYSNTNSTCSFNL